MKHKHHDKIVAKAKNMDLVLFSMSTGHNCGKWSECNRETMPKDNENINYFLCLPQHKKICLYWLNGGDVQYKSGDGWVDASKNTSNYWSADNLLMDEFEEFRIKPKKEKRWIAINMSRGVYCELFDSESEARDQHPYADQFIEIEVEVL